MSGEKKTYVWETTQAIKAGNHTADAIALALGQYDPAKLLGRIQSNAELYHEKMGAALADFWYSFVSPFKYDKTNDGWELVRPVEGVDCREWPTDLTATGPTVPESWDPINIPKLFKPVPFHYEGKTRVNGLEMRQRAVDEYGCPDGQFLAEWLLEHQQYIPESWRGHYLVFPGTAWRRRVGNLSVACLFWCDGRWCLDFGWLFGGGWDADGRLLRRCDSAA